MKMRWSVWCDDGDLGDDADGEVERAAMRDSEGDVMVERLI